MEIYGKLWNCNIATIKETCGHILLHEQLHARSVSYFDVQIHVLYQKIEEATVQLMTQEISAAEGIEMVASQYDDLVNILRKINRKTEIIKSDYDFGLYLFQVPVPERLN